MFYGCCLHRRCKLSPSALFHKGKRHPPSHFGPSAVMPPDDITRKASVWDLTLRVMELRRPLYDSEEAEASTSVCVTGGTGYIAAAIIERLLFAGHTVNTTVRDLGVEAKLAHLRSLPGAATRLNFFQADLTRPGSFDTAIAGCKYVIHTASPVRLAGPVGRARELLIEPALEGVQNVLDAVNRTASVQRVVLTSSVSAVVGVNGERGRGHVYSEEDWDLSASETFLPYHYSKTLAEREAWRIARGQDRWTLVAILPGVVQGPPLGNIKCESVGMVRRLLNGGYWPFQPRLALDLVDVDDTAAGHTLAMVTPKAQGRYLLVAESMHLPEYVQLFRRRYGAYKLPFWSPPYWVLWVMVHVLGLPPGPDLLKAQWGPPLQVDCSKVKRDLGLEFLPLQQTAEDMAERVIQLGIVRRISSSNKKVS